LYGDSYSTPDGTCQRDYVHVEDIARAHVLAIDSAVVPGVYNLGAEKGTSNLEIIQAAERITGKTVSRVTGPMRPGDPAVLTATADSFKQVSSWEPKYGLDDMVQHAWAWYTR
jgi:UDP-glucose 4-epimerase